MTLRNGHLYEVINGESQMVLWLKWEGINGT